MSCAGLLALGTRWCVTVLTAALAYTASLRLLRVEQSLNRPERTVAPLVALSWLARVTPRMNRVRLSMGTCWLVRTGVQRRGVLLLCYA